MRTAITLTAKVRPDIMGQNHRVQCTLGLSYLQILYTQHVLQRAIRIKNEILVTELHISMNGSMLGFTSARSTIYRMIGVEIVTLYMVRMNIFKIIKISANK